MLLLPRMSQPLAKAGCDYDQSMSGSLIGRLGSSAFRVSTASVSMSLAGSCFSSESHDGRAMPEAVTADLVFTISLKRSPQNR
jgi:hypothetical protein